MQIPMTPNPQPSVPGAEKSALDFVSGEQSLLAEYVIDQFNDGTYTLHLCESDTRKLWNDVDAQTLELRRMKSRETALRLALRDLVFAAENADETGYVTDVGFIDLDAIYDKAHALTDDLNPTHWQPLPPPPAADGPAQGKETT